MKNSEKMELFQALSSDNLDTRRAAILKLGKSRDPHIFKILAGYFFDNPPGIRDALFQVFTAHRERWVAEIVADTLLSNNLSARSLAIDILQEIGAESVPPLKRLLKNGNPVIRKIAAEILGKIGTPGVGEILLSHIQESDESVLFAIIESLGEVREIKAFPYFIQYYQTHPALRATILSAALKIIQHWQDQLLASNGIKEDEFLLMAFLQSIKKNGNMFAFNKCAEVLKSDVTPHIKKEAIRSLISLLKKNRYLTLPQNFCPEVEAFKTEFAAEGAFEEYLLICSRIGSPKCFEILVEAYQDSSWHRIARSLLVDFINLFPEIFVEHYQIIPEVVRLPLLELLVSQPDLSVDTSVDQLLVQANLPGERLFLTQLLARTGKPQYLQLLDGEIKSANLSVEKQFYLTAPLKHLKFLPVYLNILFNYSGELQKKAVKVLDDLGKEIVPSLIDRLNKKPRSEWAYFLYLISQLKTEIQFEFWKTFAENITEDNWRWLKQFIEETQPRHIVPVMLLSFHDSRELFKEIVEILRTHSIGLVRTSEFDAFLEGFSSEVQAQMNFVLNQLNVLPSGSRISENIVQEELLNYLEGKY